MALIMLLLSLSCGVVCSIFVISRITLLHVWQRLAYGGFRLLVWLWQNVYFRCSSCMFFVSNFFSIYTCDSEALCLFAAVQSFSSSFVESLRRSCYPNLPFSSSSKPFMPKFCPLLTLPTPASSSSPLAHLVYRFVSAALAACVRPCAGLGITPTTASAPP